MTLLLDAQSAANPSLGVLIFTLGGLAGAVFYLPFKKVRNWAWESYWLVYAVAGLVVVPWTLALLTSPNVFRVIAGAPLRELASCAACGAMWGVGGLTWGLMIRYLGVGLGLAIGCGLCSVAGTIVPKVYWGEVGELLEPGPGLTSLIGVGVSIAGIVFVGMAGMSKESELPDEEKKKAIAEFDFKKGILVAVFSGLMSSAMSFGLQGGESMEKLARETAPITAEAWKGMPVLVVVLLGGFLVNAAWCLYLGFSNRSTGDFTKKGAPLATNLILSALAGAIWCSQFICFKTGASAMGNTAYVGWAVLMASAIFFSTILGLALGEWKGTSGRTRSLLGAGLLLLVLSTVLSGYSGYLGEAPKPLPEATGGR